MDPHASICIRMQPWRILIHLYGSAEITHGLQPYASKRICTRRPPRIRAHTSYYSVHDLCIHMHPVRISTHAYSYTGIHPCIHAQTSFTNQYSACICVHPHALVRSSSMKPYPSICLQSTCRHPHAFFCMSAVISMITTGFGHGKCYSSKQHHSQT